MSGSAKDKPDESELYQMSLVESLPVTEKELRTNTRRDPILARVVESVQNGWKGGATDPEVAPYANRKDKLTLLHGEVLLWGTRVIVPKKLQGRVLQTIHEGHIGIVKMKGVARPYVWWPNLDKDIERTARECEGCQEIARNPISHSEISDDAGQGIAVADGHVPATNQDLPGDQDSFPAVTSEMTAAVQTPS